MQKEYLITDKSIYLKYIHICSAPNGEHTKFYFGAKMDHWNNTTTDSISKKSIFGVIAQDMKHENVPNSLCSKLFSVIVPFS